MVAFPFLADERPSNDPAGSVMQTPLYVGIGSALGLVASKLFLVAGFVGTDSAVYGRYIGSVK